MSRRATSVALIVALVVALLLGLLAGSPAGAAQQTRITVDLQRHALPGTTVYLTADLVGPGAVDRPVQVQQRRGSGWVTVARQRSESSYGVQLDLRVPERLGPVTWRVVAPRVRVRGRVLPAVVSEARTVRVVRQRLAWTLPRSVEVDTQVLSPVRFRPPVPGTTPTLEQLVNGRWMHVEVARSRRFAFVHTTRGPSRFRVQVGSDRYAYRTMTGTPTDVVRPTRRLSTTSDGSQLGAGSAEASASDDGRYVAFVTGARNAVPGDTGDHADVFLKDTVTGRLTLVSRTPGGRTGDGASSDPVVSGDGSVVAFVSRAADLVAGDRNRRPDVFVWERATGAVSRVGVDATEPDVSRDGRLVVLTSGDRVLLRDRTTGTLTPVPTGGGRHRQPVLSADGSHIALTGPAGVLLWDRAAGTTTLVAAGATRPRLDDDGSVVAWAAGGQVFRRDLVSGTTTQVSSGETETGATPPAPDALSADGSVLLFSSPAPLVADDVDEAECVSEGECYYDENFTDAYVWDAATGAVTMASRGAGGAPSDYYAEGQDLLADGSGAVFLSRSVLVPGQRDRGGYYTVHGFVEVFVRDLG